MSDIQDLVKRAHQFLDRLEAVLPPAPQATDWDGAVAFRWRRSNGRGWLQPVPRISQIRLSNLQGVERQRKVMEQNTRQFVEGLPANNVLLTGARGTGKSSLVKAMLNKYAPKGLRLIEVDKSELVDLGEITDMIVPSDSSSSVTTSRSTRATPATRRSRSPSTVRSTRPPTTC
jgi:predicted AAA+ superfamily ATPase